MQDQRTIRTPVKIDSKNLTLLTEKVKELNKALEKATSLADEVASLGKRLSIEIDV